MPVDRLLVPNLLDLTRMLENDLFACERRMLLLVSAAVGREISIRTDHDHPAGIGACPCGGAFLVLKKAESCQEAEKSAGDRPRNPVPFTLITVNNYQHQTDREGQDELSEAADICCALCSTGRGLSPKITDRRPDPRRDAHENIPILFERLEHAVRLPPMPKKFCAPSP